MPSKSEEHKGVLADEYYQSLIKLHAHKIHRRREKIIRYLQEGFLAFQKVVLKLIRVGLMDRLFKDFNFFSLEKVYQNAEASSHESDSDNSSSDDEFSGGRPKSHDYETFLFGFFYFFVLQDPFVRKYLHLAYPPTAS